MNKRLLPIILGFILFLTLLNVQATDCSSNGVCVNSCQVGSEVLPYSCNSGVCCSKNYCKISEDFFSSYGFSTYSTLDETGYFASLSNQTNQTILANYIQNYDQKCGTYCFVFKIPLLGKIIEYPSRLISIENSCFIGTAIFIILLILVIYYIYRISQKKRRRH